jgi:hypothetical protein
MCTRDGCLPDPCYGYICPEGQWCWTKTYDTAVCVCPTGQVMCDGECVPGDCCSDGWCEDEIDCTTNLCDYGGLGCVFIRIGGGAGNGDLCEVGEFLSDGQKCDEMSGICDSQYCDPETDLCAPNPDGPCIKRGLPCDADVPCCFGLPCTRGYCWDGTL